MSEPLSTVTIFEGDSEDKPKILRTYLSKTGKIITRYVREPKDRGVNKNGEFRKERCDKGIQRRPRIRREISFNEVKNDEDDLENKDGIIYII